MAMKKAKTKKKGAPKKPPMAKPPAAPSWTDDKCNVPHLCEFAKNVSAWLQWFVVDYQALRVAVCNVEKQAFTSTGVNSKPPKFCTGGPVNEPLPPPPPPVW